MRINSCGMALAHAMEAVAAGDEVAATFMAATF
jgi:hypothetical protein